ncbi:MAG: DUF1778 domain-containing protein [Desulfovibrionaceae bacterium]|nr:DUF1778 domain-containing protein [Desulfovibrionaceae bacterium]
MTQQSDISMSRYMSRIDARIPLAVRDTIDRAAAMQGRTHTNFLIEAALGKAHLTPEMDRSELTCGNPRDYQILIFPHLKSRWATEYLRKDRIPLLTIGSLY